jgi:hypothetical protein
MGADADEGFYVHIREEHGVDVELHCREEGRRNPGSSHSAILDYALQRSVENRAVPGALRFDSD